MPPRSPIRESASSATHPVVVHQFRRSGAALTTGSQLRIHRSARIGFWVQSPLGHMGVQVHRDTIPGHDNPTFHASAKQSPSAPPSGTSRPGSPKTADLVDDAIHALSRSGPALGRPLVDTITSSKIKKLKKLRPGSGGASEIRILFVFDLWRSAILLVAGNRRAG